MLIPRLRDRPEYTLMKHQADEAAREFGGIWHVVYSDGRDEFSLVDGSGLSRRGGDSHVQLHTAEGGPLKPGHPHYQAEVQRAKQEMDDELGEEFGVKLSALLDSMSEEEQREFAGENFYAGIVYAWRNLK